MKYYIVSTINNKEYKKEIDKSDYWKLPLYAILLTALVLTIGFYFFIKAPLLTTAIVSLMTIIGGIYRIKV